MARVFAFLLLDAAHNKTHGTLENVVRLMRVALKAAKSCIGKQAQSSVLHDVLMK